MTKKHSSNKVKVPLAKKVFYISFAAMEANILFSTTGFPPEISASFSKIISVIFFLACFLKILFSKYTIKEAGFYAIFLALMVLSAYISGDNRALWLGLTIVCAKDLDKKKLVKNSLYVLVGIFLIASFCSLLGVIDVTRLDYLGNVRVVLGFGHPNMFSLFCNLIILHLVFLFYDKVNMKHIVVTSMIATAIFIACQSRTGFLTYIITLVFLILFRKTKSKNVLLISSVIILFFAAVFSLLPIIYTPTSEVLNEMNTFLTGRLSQAHYYFLSYGILPFGQPLFEELNAAYTQNILDIGYSRMYLYNGAIYYLAVMLGYILLIVNTVKTNDRKLMLLVCFFLVYMCSENPGTYVFFNISMLYFFNGVQKKELKYDKNS